MEKNNNIWQKVLTISFVVISFLFVLLLMLFMFNNTIGENFVTEVQDNAVVSIIVIVMSVLYFLNAIVLGVVTFYNKGTLDNITVNNSDNSSTKITRGSIISVVKHNAKFIDGVQVKGVNILQDQKGGLHLSVVIRVVSVPVEEVVTPFRFILYNAFMEFMGVEFESIDFVVTALKPKYTPDMDAVEAQTNALKAKKEKLKAKQADMDATEEKQEADQLAEEAKARKEEIEKALLAEEEPVTTIVEEEPIVEEPVAEVEAEEVATEQEETEDTVEETTEEAVEEPEETVSTEYHAEDGVVEEVSDSADDAE